MKSTFITQGTCARFIDIELDGKIVREINFIGGCSGNAQGIAALVKGRSVDEVISCLKGLVCRSGTSCPDQLSQALLGMMEKMELAESA